MSGPTHRRVHAQLGAYLDGELSPAAHELISAHLLECDECAAELRSLRESERTLRDLGAVDPDLVNTRAALARFRLAVRDEPLPASFYAPVTAPPARQSRLSRAALPVLTLALLFVFAIAFTNPTTPATNNSPSWSTFAGHLDSPKTPFFRIEYPAGWSLTQVKFSPPLLATMRFSNYKPSLAADLMPDPAAAENAEVWVAFGLGSLKNGWPADEVKDLVGRGYAERELNLAGYTATRLTDVAPHFGTYDVVYLPVGDNFTLRVHLSTANANYESIFDRMLSSLELSGH